MDLYSNVKRVTYKLIFVILLFFILLWCSIFLYGLIYYLYIPAVAHFRPIYFQYEASCDARVCRFPSANVSFVSSGYNQLLAHRQIYAVEVSLDMPESERNINQGMFMVKMNMLAQDGSILRTSLRPTVLHYKSPLFRTIYTLFFSPALLAGTFEEKQMLIVSLFEDYEENSYKPTYYIYVEIQARYIEIYSATVRIHAQFKGLRYFMYYWPIFSTFIGVSSNFFFLCVVMLITVVRYLLTSAGGVRVPQRKKASSLNLRPMSSGRKLEESCQLTELSSKLPIQHHTSLLPQESGIEEFSKNTSGQRFGVEVMSALDDMEIHRNSLDLIPQAIEESDLVKSIRRRNIMNS